VSSGEKPLPLKPRVTFGKFTNVDLRVVRVLAAPLATGTAKPCRVLTLDADELGRFISVGQFALVPEDELVDRKLIACCNLGPREMGPHTSEVLVLGVPHPDSPEDQEQALPLYVDARATCGDPVF